MNNTMKTHITKKEFPKFVEWLVANGYKRLPTGLERYEAIAMYRMDEMEAK